MPVLATIADISRHEGRTVALHGWVYNSTPRGKLLFVQVRDGSGVMQAVVRKQVVGEAAFDTLKRAGQESSVVLTGEVKADTRSKIGFELAVTECRVLHAAEGYPISPKEHGPAFLHDHRHLWLRSRRTFAIMKIRHLCVKAIRDYFDDRGFTLIDSPMFTPNACEGTSTLFETEYFGQKAYLTQSGQLYQEAGAMAFGKSYCFGPTFRAEKSSTRRHLTEFWMVEPEVAFADLETVMSLSEDFLVEVVSYVLKEGRSYLEILERDLSRLEAVQKPFPRMSYDEACEKLSEIGVEMTPEDDFGSPQETALTELFERPVLIHRFPSAVKAFYMRVDPQNPLRALGVDVLAPEGYGEIIGGGERETDLEVLLQKIDEHKLPEEAFSWYLDLRRYGSVPHGGFGLGLERLVCWICGIRHIRETIPFPRMIDRLTP